MQKQQAIRSDKIMNHARGKPCTLRFTAICNGNPETTVLAHIRDRHKGMAIKASDIGGVHACSACHEYLDVGHGTHPLLSTVVMQNSIINAMKETLELQVRDGIVFVQQNAAPRPKAAKPRKPKADRARIQSRGFSTTMKRKMSGTVAREASE